MLVFNKVTDIEDWKLLLINKYITTIVLIYDNNTRKMLSWVFLTKKWRHKAYQEGISVLVEDKEHRALAVSSGSQIYSFYPPFFFFPNSFFLTLTVSTLSSFPLCPNLFCSLPLCSTYLDLGGELRTIVICLACASKSSLF